MYVCMYVCVYVCMCMYDVCVYVCMYVCMYVCVYECMCMYVCVCACVRACVRVHVCVSVRVCVDERNSHRPTQSCFSLQISMNVRKDEACVRMVSVETSKGTTCANVTLVITGARMASDVKVMWRMIM